MLLPSHMLGLGWNPAEKMPDRGLRPDHLLRPRTPRSHRMRTLPIADSTPDVAWLESLPRDGQPSLRAEMTQLPFTIGRNESCDLTIESARISREHLRIEQGPTGYLVRDLGSTNGTYVNGVKVSESPLADGDMLAVANVNLIFHLPSNHGHSLVTQRFTENIEAENDAANHGQEMVEAVRRLLEIGLSRAMRQRVQAIVDVQTNATVGYEARPVMADLGPNLRFDSGSLGDLECTALRRMLNLHRHMAVEQVWSCLGDVRIFLPAQANEIGSDLLDELERLRQRPGGEARLALQIPCATLTDHATLKDFHEQLREMGMELALDQFVGGAAQLKSFRECPPDYLRLAADVIQAVGRSADQRQRVHELIQTAQAMGTQVIACGVKNEEQWSACKNVGIAMAQGDYAAASLPLDGIHR